MICKSKQRLRIDPDFERLQIPMSKEEKAALKKDILSNGVKKSIHVWKDFILDGHKRYRICTANSLPFAIKEYNFSSKWEAMEWICSRNLSLPALTDEQTKYYIGKRYLLRSDPGRSANSRFHGERETREDIGTEIGEPHKLHWCTVVKYSAYAAGIDAIYRMESEVAEKILMDEVILSQGTVIEISQLSPDDLRIIKNCFQELGHKRVLMTDIWYELKWNRVHPSIPGKAKDTEPKPKIKEMPEFDPDAELSSLSWTIPSWRSSLERLLSISDFGMSSEGAKNRLSDQLKELSDTAERLLQKIKGETTT